MRSRGILAAIVLGLGTVASIAGCGTGATRPVAGASAPSPVGSWLVTPKGGPTAAIGGQNLLTFTSDGLILWTGGMPAVKDGHGAWVKTGDRTAEVTFVAFRHDASGHFLGRAKSWATVTFDPAFDQFDAKAVNEMFDLDGRVVAASRFDAHAARINAEHLPSLPPATAAP